MKRNDILLLLALVLVGAAALIFTRVGKGDAATVEVYREGALVWQCPLGEGGAFEAAGVNVEVGGGQARVTRADCPDQLCVRMGAISKAGESIVCLPNKVSVVLSGENALDAVLD